MSDGKLRRNKIMLDWNIQKDDSTRPFHGVNVLVLTGCTAKRFSVSLGGSTSMLADIPGTEDGFKWGWWR